MSNKNCFVCAFVYIYIYIYIVEIKTKYNILQRKIAERDACGSESCEKTKNTKNTC